MRCCMLLSLAEKGSRCPVVYAKVTETTVIDFPDHELQNFHVIKEAVWTLAGIKVH